MRQVSPVQGALSGLCPRCKSKTLFAGWVRFADKCRACDLDYSSFNVGDGPAAFLILIIGAILVASALFLDGAASPPWWVHLVWIPVGLGLTILLGLSFTFFQAWEYIHAPFAFKGSIYGSTFFMATGFHGFHVIVGTIFLIVCLARANKGDFTPRAHFGFEAAAWYWHFVDVVWLFLFVSIYVWGGWGAPMAG